MCKFRIIYNISAQGCICTMLAAMCVVIVYYIGWQFSRLAAPIKYNSPSTLLINCDGKNARVEPDSSDSIFLEWQQILSHEETVVIT